jgi:hypothetical protein
VRFKVRNAKIDWEAGKLLSLRRQPKSKEHGKEASTESRADIQTLSASAFGDLCATDEVSQSLMHSV